MLSGLLGLVIRDKDLVYALVQKRAGRLVLAKKGIIPLPEQAALSSLLSPLKNFLEQEHISVQKIFVSLLRDDVLTHQLTLPKMAKSEIEEVIMGEIEKIPAFSDRKFEYVYTVHDLDERRVKVLFSAYFADVFSRLREQIKEMKIPLESIELGPLNLLPALYAVNDAKEDAFLIVDEKSTYVMVVNKKQCRFFYATSTGINDLRTEKTGAFNTLAFSNWTEELKRIIKSYDIEYRRSGIERVWLVWDKQSIPDLDNKLQNEMNKPVFPLTPSYILRSSASQKEENPWHTLAAAPVSAWARNLKSEISYEAFMREARFKKTVSRVFSLALVYILFLAGAAGAVNFEFFRKYKQVLAQKKAVDSEIAELDVKAEQLRREQSELLSVKNLLLSQAEFVRKLNRVSWSKVFGEISDELPAELCLTSFKIQGAGQVDVQGEALKIESVAELMRTIKGSKVLRDAKFESLNEKNLSGKKEKVFSFQIKAGLREGKNGR